jgi:hypothetical protein
MDMLNNYKTNFLHTLLDIFQGFQEAALLEKKRENDD